MPRMQKKERVRIVNDLVAIHKQADHVERLFCRQEDVCHGCVHREAALELVDMLRRHYWNSELHKER